MVILHQLRGSGHAAMSAPPVMRPLRAILQRRLQIAPSRPIRTPLVSKASQFSSHIRFNSSIPPTQTPTPDKKAIEDVTAKTESTPAKSTVKETCDDATTTLTHVSETKAPSETRMKDEARTPAASETVVQTPKAASDKTASASPARPPARTLDQVFLRSGFQKVRSADLDIQAGIEAVLKLQLEAAASPARPPTSETDSTAQEVEQLGTEAHRAQKAANTDVVLTDEASVGTATVDSGATATEKDVNTPEHTLAEVAEAVFSEAETQAGTTSQTSVQKPSISPAEATSLEPGSPEVTKQVLPDSLSPQVAATESVPGSSTQFMAAESHGTKAKPMKSNIVSGLPKEHELAAPGPGITQFAETVLDKISLEAAATAASDAASAGQSQDAFVDSLLKVRQEAHETTGASGAERATGRQKKPKKKSEKKAKLTAVERELARLQSEMPDSAEGLKATLSGEAEPSRLPRNVQALYLQPLRRVAQYGVPSCDLQLRSYSVRPLESFCDFALRAAYYCGLPAYGPVPLPKIVERWTVPRSSFIFKKSQENFERITRRRLIQIRDGHPQTIQMWLAFLQKHQQAAVGMKANIWEYSSIDVAKELDKAYEEAERGMDKSLKYLGQTKAIETAEKVDEILQSERYKLAAGGQGRL